MSKDQVDWQKRAAMSLASQLPDTEECAWDVLTHLVKLQATFYGPPPAAVASRMRALFVRRRAATGNNVVQLPAGGASPNLRARASDKPSGRPK